MEKGVLKNFVLTRQPMRGFQNTNGHARLPGNFGARAAAVSNLFIQSTEASPAAQLRRKLIDICKQRDKPYGIIVRKLDFPSSAAVDEVRRILSGAAGGTHPVSLPILVYRVYADGREELIRGVRFRGRQRAFLQGHHRGGKRLQRVRLPREWRALRGNGRGR